MIGALIESPSNLDVCLKTEVTKVEIIPRVIKPGISPNINASGDVAEQRVRAGTKMSGPSSTRVRDGGVAAEGSTQTFGGEIAVGAVKRHGSIESGKTRMRKSPRVTLAFIPR
jgi:hypothetical protein